MGPKKKFSLPKSYFFCDLKLRAKFPNPRTTPSGRKVCGGEEEKKKNNTKYSGHFVPQQRPRAAHAPRSDQWEWMKKNEFTNTTDVLLKALGSKE